MAHNRALKEANVSAANAESRYILTFDDFFNDGYGGFIWEHFENLDSSSTNPGGGSGGKILLNLWAQGSSFYSVDSPFGVESLRLQGALEPLTITIVGQRDGQEIYTKTVSVDTAFLKKVDLGWEGVDRIYFFVDPEGTENPDALYFHLDDVVINNGTGSISGSVIADDNINGALDPGETGLRGRTVILDDNGNGVVDEGERSTTTDARGAYRFDWVGDGTHTITQVQDENWIPTGAPGPLSVSVTDGSAATADLFAGRARDVLGSVSGVIFNDRNLDGVHDRGETPLAGWTVYIDADGDGIRDAGERTAVTDANGRYMFDRVAPGEVTVQADLPLAWQQWSGGAGTATVTSGTRTGNADVAVTGGATSGDDRLVGIDASAETIDALAGNDRVIARGGDDRVSGGAGDDTLGGGYGNDWLFGGAGNDRLIGGSGADVFVIDGAGVDRIADLTAEDRIQITALGIDTFADLTITARGNFTAIGWAGKDVAVLLWGIAPDAVDPSMFVFGA